MLTPEALGSQSCGDSGGGPAGPGWPRPQRHGGQRCTAACAWPRRLTAVSAALPARLPVQVSTRPVPSPLLSRRGPSLLRPALCCGRESISVLCGERRPSLRALPAPSGDRPRPRFLPACDPQAFAPANLPLPPLLPLCLLQAASVALCPEPGAPLCDGPRCTPGVTERPPALAWRPALGPTSACPGLLACGLLQHRAGLASNLVLFSSGISDGTFR